MMKICERCGNEFECLHSDHCWCLEVKIPEHVSQAIKNKYKDCLCRSCLLEIIERDKNLNQKGEGNFI